MRGFLPIFNQDYKEVKIIFIVNGSKKSLGIFDIIYSNGLQKSELKFSDFFNLNFTNFN